ncbi:MAG: hypothetical protein J7L42_01055 [Elusimicrobia bacterium]|nr:hypothetical protein [Elusimicrobiota bacterium]
MRLGIWSFVLLFFVLSQIYAAGETALNFLRIDASARGAALGSSSVADESEDFVFYNPACLTNLERKKVSLMHISLYADINYESGIVFYPYKKFNFSFDFNYLHTSAPRTIIDLTQPYEFEKIGKYKFEDRLIGFGISPRKGIWGVKLKYIDERIEEEKAKGTAFDLGILIREEKFLFGISLLNIGPPVEYIKKKEELPRTISVGGKFLIKWTGIFGSFKMYPDRKTSFHTGVEISYRKIAFLRAGFKKVCEWDDDFSPFTFGAGLKLGNFGFDWAFIPSQRLGDSQEFSLWFFF